MEDAISLATHASNNEHLDMDLCLDQLETIGNKGANSYGKDVHVEFDLSCVLKTAPVNTHTHTLTHTGRVNVLANG